MRRLFIAIILLAFAINLASCGKEPMNDEFVAPNEPKVENVEPTPQPTQQATQTAQPDTNQNDGFPSHLIQVIGQGDYEIVEWSSPTNNVIRMTIHAPNAYGFEYGSNGVLITTYGDTLDTQVYGDWSSDGAFRIIFGNVVQEYNYVSGEHQDVSDVLFAAHDEALAIIPHADDVKDVNLRIRDLDESFAFYRNYSHTIIHTTKKLNEPFDAVVTTHVHELAHALDHIHELYDNQDWIDAFEDSKARWLNNETTFAGGYNYEMHKSNPNVSSDFAWYGHSNFGEYVAMVYQSMYGIDNTGELMNADNIQEYEPVAYQLMLDLQ